MTLESIVQFILYPSFTGWFLLIKIVFIIIFVFFLGLIIYVLLKTDWLNRLIIWDLKEFLTYRHFGLPRFDKKWAEIQERIKVGTEPEVKLAVIEADMLLDDALKGVGHRGESLEERLDKLTTDVLSNLQELKEAHKIRSHIIHDPSYHLEIDDAKKLLDAYEKALIDLQVL